MKEIQDKDFWYCFLRPYVDWYFRHSYRRMRYVGREKIPTDGAIIYAPNHQNGLMDALAVLAIDSGPKVFVARADIFRNPKIAYVLRWLKIMPISRVRDGLDQVRRNDETMDRAVEVLKAGVPFCILPEGTHRRKHALLPLQKGIFHIALRAVENMENKQKLYIVPVGLEYGDWYHQWDDLTVTIGDAIDVKAFMAEHRDKTEPQLINAMREELSGRMSGLFTCLADDETYEAKWAEIEKERLQEAKKRMGKWRVAIQVARIVGVLIMSPLALVSAVVSLPLWIVPLGLRGKVKDPAFRNSILYVWTWALLPWLLFIPLGFWMLLQEEMYQIRKAELGKLKFEN